MKSHKTTCITKAIALSLSVLVATAPNTALADLEGTMESAFNAEVNITEPGAYMGSRRGAVTLGKIRVANKISSVKLISFTPPGIKAGCGGIDMWGGSFSFISGRQLEALGRNIISNALGYAFQLALSKFPDGKDAMKYIQDQVNKANALTKNSCETAQKLVDKLFDVDKKVKEDAASKVTSTGLSSDFLSSKDDPLTKLSNSALASTQTFRPNPIYSALTESQVADWFPNGGGDFVESIMSLTGAIIFNKDQPTLKPQYHESVLDVNDLVIGGSVTLLKCGDSEFCATVTPQVKSIRGFQDMIYVSLVGKPGQVGIIDQFYAGTTVFSPAQKQLLGALSPNVGGILRDLSRNPGVAKQFAREASNIIAYNTACNMSSEMLRSIAAAAAAATWSGSAEAGKVVNDARAKQYQQCDSARKSAADLTTMLQLQNQLNASFRKG